MAVDQWHSCQQLLGHHKAFLKWRYEEFKKYINFLNFMQCVVVRIPSLTRNAKGTATPAAVTISKIEVTANQCREGSHPGWGEYVKLVLIKYSMPSTNL